MIECPECENSYSPQGLFGHLDRGHGLNGEKLYEAYEQALDSQKASGEARPEPASQQPAASGQPAESPEATSRKRRPVPKAGQARQAGKRDERETEGTEQDRPGLPGPLRSAVERLRRARARREAVEEEMETKKEGGGFLRSSKGEVPANETWRELREKYEAELVEARSELQSQVERREEKRSM